MDEQQADYEERRKAWLRSRTAYERPEAMELVRQAARLLAEPGDMVMYRSAFRWLNDADDSVLPNHYECQSLLYLAEEFGYEIVHNFNHVAVVRRKTP